LAVSTGYILSPVSIQTQSLALRALRKRKPHETQALALAREPIMVATALTEHFYWLALAFVREMRLRFLRFSFTQRTQRKRLRLNGNRT